MQVFAEKGREHFSPSAPKRCHNTNIRINDTAVINVEIIANAV